MGVYLHKEERGGAGLLLADSLEELRQVCPRVPVLNIDFPCVEVSQQMRGRLLKKKVRDVGAEEALQVFCNYRARRRREGMTREDYAFLRANSEVIGGATFQ